MKLTGKKFILLLLYTPTEGSNVNVPIAGRTRLMKMGFLFKNEIKADFEKNTAFDEINLPEYFAWKYGPFSGELLNDLEFLINQNYIKCLSGISSADITTAEVEYSEYDYWVDDIEEFRSKEYNEESFVLSDNKGIQKAKVIWDILTYEQKALITDFKKILNQAPLSRILKYVYKKYKKDGYIDKSLIRERYLA